MPSAISPVTRALAAISATTSAAASAAASGATPAAAAPANLPATLARHAAFGPPPLIAGEDAAAYEALCARVAGAVAPADVLEEMRVRDVVDLDWEAQRLRRLQAALLRAAAHEGLAVVLTPLLGLSGAHDLAAQWAAGKRRAARRVRALLAAAGLGQDAVAAQTFAACIGDFERIDRMIMQAESRRAAALHEIEFHRALLAHALREALADEDAEYEDEEDEADEAFDGAVSGSHSHGAGRRVRRDQ